MEYHNEPAGFITAKSGVEKRILQRIVDEHWVYGCVSMPSNVFATTGTNVSVILFDKSAKTDKVILIDASKMGEEYKEGNKRMADYKQTLAEQFAESHKLEKEIMEQLNSLVFNLQVGQQ